MSLLVTLVTVLASGVVSAIITYKLNRDKEHTFFMRKKAEEAYLATDEFCRELGSHMVALLSVVEGHLSYNQFLELQASNPPKKVSGGHEVMEMLIRIYLPELEHDLEELHAARDHFGELRTAHKSAYKEGFGDDGRFAPSFRSAMRRVADAQKALKSGLVGSARRHATENTTVQRLKAKYSVRRPAAPETNLT